MRLKIIQTVKSEKPPLTDLRNKHFGFMLTLLGFTCAAYFKYIKINPPLFSSVMVVVGITAAIITFLAPKLFTPLTKAWFLLGDLMGKIFSPLVLGAFFYLLITPTGLLGRLFGRDELRLKKSTAPSYWIIRDPQPQRVDPFKNQF